MSKHQNGKSLLVRKLIRNLLETGESGHFYLSLNKSTKHSKVTQDWSSSSFTLSLSLSQVQNVIYSVLGKKLTSSISDDMESKTETVVFVDDVNLAAHR